MSTERDLPAELSVLAPFVDAGLFDAACMHVTATIARACATYDTPTLLAAALATRAVTVGHVCVELSQIAGTIVVDDDDGLSRVVELPWPDPTDWIAALGTSAAVSLAEAPQGATIRPLVLSGSRLYLERYWRFERRVAAELIRRATASGGFAVSTEALDAALDKVFGPSDPSVPDLQRIAAAHALTSPLTVIAGGPGTGKTRTVAGVLIAAQELAVQVGRAVEIALAAPTAKAASRITVELSRELDAAEVSDTARASATRTEAMTIHRLLGANGRGEFAHDAANPLVHDLVIVDETSMVSLPLMARLLAAVREGSGLVLVGDPFQLTSVEAGAVLGEITGVNRATTSSGALASAVIRLERVHRFGDDSAIAALAAAIRIGDGMQALEILRAGGEVRWVDPDDDAELAAVQHQIVQRAVEVIRHARLGEGELGFAKANSTKILCATRRGPLGVSGWTERIEQGAARAFGESSLGRRWYIGRPVIVNRNDYLNQTVNGDIGLVVADDGQPLVELRTGIGLRTFVPAQLGDIDTWWAMTIHKSQGSEFDDVILSLPPAPSPVLTRELLYTAVTRARASVTIVSSEAAILSAISRPVARASGLADLLWTS